MNLRQIMNEIPGYDSPGMRCLAQARARGFMPNQGESALLEGLVQRSSQFQGKARSAASLYNTPLDRDSFRLSGESRNAGDANPLVQMQVMKMILEKSRDLGDADRAILLATARLESGFNPDAASPITSAAGIFQFVSKTGASYGLDKSNVFEAEHNIDAGISLYQDNVYKLPSRHKFSGLDLEAKGELAYALHHDGPSLAYGGREVAKEGLVPYLGGYLELVRKYDTVCATDIR